MNGVSALWVIFQVITLYVEAFIFRGFKTNPLSLVCFISAVLYKMPEFAYTLYYGKKPKGWINNIFNVIMASLSLTHIMIYDIKVYYLLVALYSVQVITFLSYKLAICIFSTRGENSTLYTQTNSKPEEQCCICLEQLTSNVVSLQCLHSFHRWCICEWNRTNATCPVCRTVVN